MRPADPRSVPGTTTSARSANCVLSAPLCGRRREILSPGLGGVGCQTPGSAFVISPSSMSTTLGRPLVVSRKEPVLGQDLQLQEEVVGVQFATGLLQHSASAALGSSVTVWRTFCRSWFPRLG